MSECDDKACPAQEQVAAIHNSLDNLHTRFTGNEHAVRETRETLDRIHKENKEKFELAARERERIGHELWGPKGETGIVKRTLDLEDQHRGYANFLRNFRMISYGTLFIIFIAQLGILGILWGIVN